MSTDSGPNWSTVPTVVALLLVTLFMVGFDNPTLWRASLASDSAATPWLTVTAALAMLTTLFYAVLRADNFPWLFKPLANELVVLAAGTGYFMSGYGVIIDAAISQYGADRSREASALLTQHFYVHMLAGGAARRPSWC